ncbi:MAG: hypothetical protein U1F43_31775 [Myxococcota bacterium]
MITRTSALLLALVGIAACGGSDNNGTEKDTAVATDTPVDTIQVDTSVAPDTTVAPDVTPDTTTCGLGAACDDGDPCTTEDACDATGACKGKAKCDDGLACTTDSCAEGVCTNAVVSGFCAGGADLDACVSAGGKDPANTCRQCAAGNTWNTLADDVGCSDGDVCTTNDKCHSGACVGGPALECPSDTPCVSRTCDAALGCVDSNTTAACDDHDPCTVGDTCAGGTCKKGTDELACDDHNPCTVDSCQPGVGCVFDGQVKCDDHQPCTKDTCDVGTGACSNTDIADGGDCDDADPCTSGETCNAAHQCQGGTATICDDQNACTLDTCASDKGGCLYLFLTQPCDDGYSCTHDDLCVAGECFGAKTSACGLCPLAGDLHANKVVSLELMSDGNAGSGLDVDGDPGTCAPADSCSAGVDNELSLLASLMNPAMSQSIGDGVVKWVADLSDMKTDGTPFGFSIYDSSLSFDSAAIGCDYQVDTCAYDTAPLSFGPDCKPYFHLDGMRIANGTMSGGGDGQLISMVLPLATGALISVTIANAQVEASVTFDADNHITSMNGIVAGAIPKAQLLTAIEGLDQNDLPIDKEAAIQLLDLLVEPDIDLDGDGLDEAASLGMRFRTIPAIINPVEVIP